jgi:hypothetical protein
VAGGEESGMRDGIDEEQDIEGEDAKEEVDVKMTDFVDMVESQKVFLFAQAVEADSDAEEKDAVKVEKMQSVK